MSNSSENVQSSNFPALAVSHRVLSQAHCLNILGTLNEGVAIITHQGTILYDNLALRIILQQENLQQSLCERNIQTLFSAEEFALFDKQIRKQIINQSMEFDFTYQQSSQNPKNLRVKASPRFVENGAPSGYYLFFEDITQTHSLIQEADALRKENQTLQQANLDLLNELARQKEELANTILKYANLNELMKAYHGGA